MDYYGESLLFEIDYIQSVNECQWGLFGQLFSFKATGGKPDGFNCNWRHYRPDMPVWSIQITEAADFYDSYYPYRCMNWYSADWEDWPLSEETIE